MEVVDQPEELRSPADQTPRASEHDETDCHNANFLSENIVNIADEV